MTTYRHLFSQLYDPYDEISISVWQCAVFTLLLWYIIDLDYPNYND